MLVVFMGLVTVPIVLIVERSDALGDKIKELEIELQTLSAEFARFEEMSSYKERIRDLQAQMNVPAAEPLTAPPVPPRPRRASAEPARSEELASPIEPLTRAMVADPVAIEPAVTSAAVEPPSLPKPLDLTVGAPDAHRVTVALAELDEAWLQPNVCGVRVHTSGKMYLNAGKNPHWPSGPDGIDKLFDRPWRILSSFKLGQLVLMMPMEGSRMKRTYPYDDRRLGRVFAGRPTSERQLTFLVNDEKTEDNQGAFAVRVTPVPCPRG